MDDLKLSLFYKKRDSFLLIVFLLFILLLNLFLKYQNYRDFTSQKYRQTEATVINQFKKSTKTSKTYYILKLKDKNGVLFYGISWKKGLKDLKNCRISFKVKSDKIDFKSYLKGFFAPIYGVKTISCGDTLRAKLFAYISKQHKEKFLKELFCALFLGGSIDKDARAKIQNIGVSHLVAISGFHLGVLSAILFLMLTPFYRFFQDRYFPYRNLKFDLMVVVWVALFCYLYMVGFLPSLLRAFVMLSIGYLFYIRHIKILSFQTILLTVLIVLCFYPELIFSISFWFSISGVFYIFLFLHYFKDLKPWHIFIFVGLWVYFMMMPIVHYIFGSFGPYQLLSPFISIAFIIFYPLELFLHIFGYGGLLDKAVVKLFSFDISSIEIKTPLWFLMLFISTSLLAIYKKIFLYILIFLDALFFAYLFYRYTFG